MNKDTSKETSHCARELVFGERRRLFSLVPTAIGRQVAETSPSMVLQAQYTEGRQVWVFGAVLFMQEARSRLMK